MLHELKSYSQRIWEPLFESGPREKPARYWLDVVTEKSVARKKFWLYIIDALRQCESVHCQVRITGLEGIPGLGTWLFVQGIDRPWIIGSLESSMPLYGEHALDLGTQIPFRCENICRVLLTQDG